MPKYWPVLDVQESQWVVRQTRLRFFLLTLGMANNWQPEQLADEPSEYYLEQYRGTGAIEPEKMALIVWSLLVCAPVCVLSA